MKISIIIPVYNKAEYVESCLRSLMGQDFEGFEIVCVDDGSTDDSALICDRMALEDHRIRVLHTANSGVTAARRKGLALARGRYVMFVDSDDGLLPGSLQMMYEAIVDHNADEVIAPYQNQNGDVFDFGCRGFVDGRDIIRNYLATRNSFQAFSGILYRKELLEGCLDFTREIIIGEDSLAHIRVLVKNPRVYCIGSCNYLYVQGLPNTRKRSLQHEMAYDSVLRQSLQPMWEDMELWFLLRQLKTYEVFIDERQFHVYKEYYHLLKGKIDKRLPLLDRIAFALPPRLAYLPIHLYKKWLRRKSKQVFQEKVTNSF